MYQVVENPLILSETWQWDKDTDEFIDCGSDPPIRHPASSYSAKVKVYEARVREWFLSIAQDYVGKGETSSDYLVLSIALAYIEGVEQYRRGMSTPQGKAGKWFKNSAKRIFCTSSQDALDRLWKECRCGLFHCGFTDGRTYLSHGYAQAISINGLELQINPLLFVEAVCNDFTTYVNSLQHRKVCELSKNFEKLWDYRWESS